MQSLNTPWVRSCWLGVLLGGVVPGADAQLPPSASVHVRGPAFDGNLGDSMIAQSRTPVLPVLWEQKVDQGFSGLVADGGVIITQGQSAAGQFLVCLSLASGRVLWRQRYGSPWELDGPYPGPFGSPTIDRGRVYFSDCFGAVLCADARKGSILWRFDAVAEFKSQGVDFGYAATPLVIQDQVFLPGPPSEPGPTLFCLDCRTGRLIWSSGTARPSYSSCIPVTAGGHLQIVLLDRNGVSGTDPASGTQLWSDSWTRGYHEHSSWPLYVEPYLFCSSPFRKGARVYRLEPSGVPSGVDLLWENKRFSNDVFSSLIHEGYVYGFDVQSPQSVRHGRTRGELKCLELASGRVMWTHPAARHCSVSGIAGHLLLMEDDGTLIWLDPSPFEYRELARVALPDRGKYWTPPLAVGSRLLVRGGGMITCYSLNGSTEPPGAAASTAVAVRQDRVGMIAGWMQRWRSEAFIAPSLGTLAEWYIAGMFLLLLAMALAQMAPVPARRGVCLAWAAVLGSAGMVALTQCFGRFLFTIPLTICVLFLGLVSGAKQSSAGQPAWFRRLLLVGFAAGCYVFHVLCERVAFSTGPGFLTGLPFLIPFATTIAQPPPACPGPWRHALGLCAAFTVFYGSGACITLWRTGQ